MNQDYAYLGRIVLNDTIIEDGAMIISDERIKSIGFRNEIELPDTVIDTKGKLIAPGFVDIHCHAGGTVWAYESPKKMSAHHLQFGTTGLLCTLYRDLGISGILNAINKVKEDMKESPNILGVHLEGPYLNPQYGAGSQSAVMQIPKKEDYLPMMESGIIKQWTFSPEVENTEELLKDLCEYKITPAIGHSAASPEQVYSAAKNGAKIVTHLTNATGSSISPTRYGGTFEVSFDHAALLCDNLFYEIICDKQGVHVRHDIIKLILKIVGVDKIIGITDACTGSLDDNDINMLGTTLMGSKLSMLQVAKNFKSLGLSICELFKITAFNPACAIGVEHEMGSLKVGKLANLLIIDEDLNLFKVILKGKEL